MAHLLLLLFPLLALTPPGFLPGHGERLATVVYLGEVEAVGPCLAGFGYDTFVARSGEELPGVLRRARDHAGRGVILVTSGALPELPDRSALAGWAAFGAAEAPAPGVPFLAFPAPLEAVVVTDAPVQRDLRRFVEGLSPLPPVGLPGARFVESPNWSVRPLGTALDTVVLHSTVVDTLEATERIFLDTQERQVSAHYVVDRDGTVVQMVDERHAAHHAGVSELGGREKVNGFSVGIEMVNRNDGVDPYPEAQVEAVAALVRDLRTRWDIPDERIVSHAQIARPVGRKSDPVGFDFADLARRLSRQGR